MATERRREPVREVQLEGLGLVLVGALVVGGLLAAFFAGRWYERRQLPDLGAAAASRDPLAHVELTDDVVDVADQAGFFDTVEGGQKQAEPAREARARGTEPPVEAPREAARPATTTAAAEAPGGPFFVQVFAGRDPSAATGLMRRLEGQGHPVRLDSDRQGSSTLYKVRVGGYPTQADAKDAADRLQASGYPGAWVTRIEP